MAVPAPHDSACLFCKIVAGQIPCHKVYEDDAVLAFLDIGPLTRGHTLVIPRRHYANALEMPPEVMAEFAARLPKISRAVLAATGAAACHLLMNNGELASQSVFHLHCHILPRRAEEPTLIPWRAGKLSAADGASLSAAIGAAVTGG